MWGMLAAAALGLANAAQPATARKSDTGEGEVICLSFLSIWRGSLEETARIETVPIPDSYRQSFAWTGCQNLSKGSLIDWHIAFGSERSVTPALQFLERTAREGILAPPEFERRLPSAIAEARKRIDALKPADERDIAFSRRAASYQAERLALRTSKEFRALRSFVAAQERYQFLAGVYLRAAAAFDSPALLAKSSEYLAPALKGAEQLFEGQRVAMAKSASVGEEAGLASVNVNTIRALEMHHAVTRARLSRAPGDIAAAAEIIRANSDPVMSEAAKAIDRGRRDYCRGEDTSYALRAACRGENSLELRLRAFWVNAALLELLGGEAVAAAPRISSSDSYQVALEVLEATEEEYFPDWVRYTPEIDERVTLYLAKSDRLLADAGPADQDGYDEADEALALLLQAERLVPFALHPNRFAAIARRYLAIIQRWPRDELAPETARFAAYFKGVLGMRLPRP